MRFDLRLTGRTGSARRCFMEMSVYASSQSQLQEEVKKAAVEGPWFDEAGVELPTTETITVEHVERAVKAHDGDG
jgi:hypothetical protein